MAGITCEHCCGAEQVFDLKEAKKQLKHYHKKGPRKTSRKLIQGIKFLSSNDKSLLEIGGGIGAVHLELLKDGLESVTSIDASSAYLELAKKESKDQGLITKIQYIHGDFIIHKKNISIHDITVLDKVICCYPDMAQLLDSSLSRTNHLFAIVYPKNNLLGAALIGLGNLYCRIKRNPFRVFLHKNKEVQKIIESHGFELKHHRLVYPWNIDVYQKLS